MVSRVRTPMRRRFFWNRNRRISMSEERPVVSKNDALKL